MSAAVIASGVRTPIGKLLGALSPLSAVQLGSIVIAEALSRAEVKPDEVDQVYMGCVLQAGLGLNPARQAALAAGAPDDTPAVTVNKVCGSGLEAVVLAERLVRAGDAEIVVAGGMESMSNAPYLLDRARQGYRMGDGRLVDSMIRDGLWDFGSDGHMAMTVEVLAEEYGISRDEQDAFSERSQRKCREAVEAGRLREEIAPVEVPQRKGPPRVVEADEFPRPDTTLEVLGRLRPAFKTGGTITAGNASGVNDGAAAVVVMSEAAAKARGLTPMAVIRSHACQGLAPERMGVAPVGAARRALERAGLSLEDMDLIELNEAFAAQTLAVGRELKWDLERVNVNGGAIALGHPIGASGARILVTLLYEMRRRKAARGVAALCIGGGEALAMVVERPEGE